MIEIEQQATLFGVEQVKQKKQRAKKAVEPQKEQKRGNGLTLHDLAEAADRMETVAPRPTERRKAISPEEWVVADALQAQRVQEYHEKWRANGYPVPEPTMGPDGYVIVPRPSSEEARG